jgi:hypothetical protein|tara:strand:+ start:3367 stop:3633 length:267 start_codon:yes stop_codon:yes gene_type:complete
MTSSPLNSPQHVERIREILIGRDLQQMHDRISRIEETPRAMASPGLQEALPSLLNKTGHSELKSRFTRLASAGMADAGDQKLNEGFLL